MAIVIFALLTASDAQAAERPAQAAGTKGWVLQFEEDFSDESFRDRWKLEGMADLTLEKEGSLRYMRIQTLQNPSDRAKKQSVLWCVQPVRGDVRYLFRTRGQARNRSIFLFNANPTKESGRTSIFDWLRDDAMYQRYAGSEIIEMYSIGTLREQDAECNVRYLGGSALRTRTFPNTVPPGVHYPVLQAFASPYLGKPEAWFELDLRVEGRTIMLLVDGRRIMEVEDGGKSQEHGTDWTPLTNGGFFAFRNFRSNWVDVDTIKVYSKDSR